MTILIAVEGEKGETVRSLGMGGKASSGGGSDGDEGNVFRQTLKANSRKRAKLQPKVSGGCNVMNTAMVPRKLRSAMSKHSTYSASLPFPVLKKQRDIAFKSNQSFTSSDAKNFSSSKIESITKDEEEVVEALTALAALVPAGKATKVTVNRGNASKEKASRHLIPLRESQEETTKAEALAPDEYVTESLCQKIDKQASGFTHLDHQSALSDENGEENQNDVNLSNFTVAPLKSLFGNGSLQAFQLEPFSAYKSSNGLWPIKPPPVERALESTKQHLVNGKKYNGGEGKSTNLQSVLPSNGNDYKTKSLSSKPAENFAGSHRLSSTANDLLTGKHALASNSRRSAWRRCSAHVYITHLILNYQNMENNEQPSLLPKPSKYKDGTCSSGGCPFAEMLPLRNGLSGIAVDGANNATTERNASEGRFQMLQDARVPKVQPAPSLVALHSHQQKQGANIFSLQSPGETCNSEHGAKSTMQLHIPYLHHQAPQNYSVMPYPYPHGPYTSAYRDHLAAAASCQLPHFVGNPFCGQQTVHAGGATAKQHLWQSNIAHYRPPPSPPQGLYKWQNGHHHHDPLLPSLTCSRPSSMFPPSISVGAVVPAEANHNVMAFLPTSSSSRALQQQDEGSHGNCEFSMERSPHLQLLYRVQNS